jgi:hypothetical protein
MLSSGGARGHDVGNIVFIDFKDMGDYICPR